MDVYKFSFVVLTGANAGLGLLQYRNSQALPRPRAGSISIRKRSINHVEDARPTNPFLDNEEKPYQSVSPADQKEVNQFRNIFFSVYVLVMAADWLQGPYLYALYKDEKELSERTVAVLFASGFVSAAIAASFIGGLADIHGRRKACLLFCATYALSCLSMLSGVVFVLFLGRVLGGISTTLMYSVFEAWMVHEFQARQMASKGMILGKVFGLMTTTSSVVAILAGIVGEGVVGWTGTKTAPFVVAFFCLCVAAGLISQYWNENYGTKTSSKDNGMGGGTDIKAIVQDKRIVALGLISCLFEGSMYLFVFFWSAALKSARSAADPSGTASSPPFGLIFATFMSAMMLGSQLFTLASSAAASRPSSPNLSLTQPQNGQMIANHVHLLSITILLAACSFLIVTMRSASSSVRKEEIILWGFCLFEATVGVYYPSMGFLKGRIVQDGIRGKVYALLRLPLNVFVVGVLGLTVEGDRHREGVFLACGGLLIVGYIVAIKYLM